MVVGSSARPEVDGSWNREGPVGWHALLDFDLSWWESIGGFFHSVVTGSGLHLQKVTLTHYMIVFL